MGIEAKDFGAGRGQVGGCGSVVTAARCGDAAAARIGGFGGAMMRWRHGARRPRGRRGEGLRHGAGFCVAALAGLVERLVLRLRDGYYHVYDFGFYGWWRWGGGACYVLAVRALSDSCLTRNGAATSLLMLFTGRCDLVSGVGDMIRSEG